MSSKPKRRKYHSGISFKTFVSRNYGRLTTRYPFLTKQQIRAKLRESWRRNYHHGGSTLSESSSACSPTSSQSTLDTEIPDSDKIIRDIKAKQGNDVVMEGTESIESEAIPLRDEELDSAVVFPLFKSWKEMRDSSGSKESKSTLTRLLASEEAEGSSNFRSMFTNKDDIFL